ncbi:cytochrome-c oxidase, cbb3-type subunit III [Rubrimonas cliftonensis]|uniref:Cbb3-type cytochrome c oxidase subunit n=1 Tax=Rubrimonas cliftonensis TaxID=89524 RepID=A0A1H4DJD1_9RHOB|nr:cytochrome-c oxidase, cbb3-type subunit III [Rubrimonas cliftonensis]SEA72824.1 cytochrome c oxidase cbb3-type subunit 3 [Rubrimonas cliftonensis]
MAEKRIDEATGVETTGHEFDGIAELNNPMPQWWLSIFYACVAFALIYTIFFPAWPMVTKATEGWLGYTARGEVAEEIAEHAESQAVWRQRIADTDIEAIRNDPELLQFAMAAGRANFAVNCSQCHGSGAAGNVGGYPNLNDDDWIWGGDLESIYTTIAHGVRNEADPDARYSEMPRYGVDELLSREEIAQVAQYVVSLSGGEQDAAAVEAGMEIYLDNCAACHGDEGLGVPEVGAPNLADSVWLYGGSAEQIAAQVWRPQQGVMPPWLGKLGETQVKELAVYVHALGGGV